MTSRLPILTATALGVVAVATTLTATSATPAAAATPAIAARTSICVARQTSTTFRSSDGEVGSYVTVVEQVRGTCAGQWQVRVGYYPGPQDDGYGISCNRIAGFDAYLTPWRGMRFPVHHFGCHHHGEFTPWTTWTNRHSDDTSFSVRLETVPKWKYDPAFWWGVHGTTPVGYL